MDSIKSVDPKAGTGLVLAEIASRIRGSVSGDSAALAVGLCSLEEPIKGGLSFIKTASNIKEIAKHRSVELAALLVPSDFDETLISKLSLSYRLNLIRVSDPFKALIELVPLFYTSPSLPPGVDSQARIDPSAQIGKDVSIGPFSWVGANVVIEDSVIIYPNVSVYPGARLGARTVIHAGAVIREHSVIEPDCVIHSGAIIGAEGFGYVPDTKAGLLKVPQIGITRLASGVEIGANACVDRATLGSTSIGKGSKVDNLVQIGHNTKIGRYSVICGLAGLAGSCKIGNNVVIGGAAGIKDHASVADGCRVAGRSEVWRDLTVPGDYMGAPAIPHFEKRRQLAALAQLPEFLKAFRKSSRRLEDSDK